MVTEQAFKTGLKAALPTSLGYLGVGIALGVIAAAEGLTVLQVFLMSGLVYAGAGQFAMVGLLAAGEPILSIMMTVFLINLRHFLMSLHTATLFKRATLREGIIVGTLLTDETYGLFLSEQLHRPVAISWMMGNNLISYVSWVLATVIGAVMGTQIPAPEMFGLDYALLAMFIGIFVTQFGGMKLTEPVSKLFKILVIIAGVFFVLAYWLPKSVAVLVATLSGCMMGVYLDER